MKQITRLFFLAFFYFITVGLSGIKGQTTTPLELMIKVNDSLYVDQTEITVDAWLSYYTWTLENKGVDMAEKLMPKENCVSDFVWEYINTKAKKKSKSKSRQTLQPIGYFQDNCPEIIEKDSVMYSFVGNKKSCIYKYYPITGITYEQAVSFCKWRTEICGNENAIFRLPSREEWRMIAILGMSEDEKMNNQLDSINGEELCAIFNYKISPELCMAQRGIDSSFAMTMGSFLPSRINSYDMFGNVSEMTFTKGEAVGGNYSLYAKQCHYDLIQQYTRPEPWLGFRCIATSKE